MGLFQKLFNRQHNEPEPELMIEENVMELPEDEMDEKIISCKHCNGYYKLRDGKYGVFAGCSNYPRCKSTQKLFEFVLEVIKREGINIYQWEKECWKCQKPTPVYSYYLAYELGEYEEYLEHACATVGIGDLTYIDELLAKKHATVQMRYSHTIKSKYMANTCTHCGAIQGRNYVVYDPHEIIGELWHHHAMDQYLLYNIPCEDTAPIYEDIRRIYAEDT